jgi:hypothetical protein
VDGLVSNRFVHSLSTGTHKGMLSLLVMWNIINIVFILHKLIITIYMLTPAKQNTFTHLRVQLVLSDRSIWAQSNCRRGWLDLSSAGIWPMGTGDVIYIYINIVIIILHKLHVHDDDAHQNAAGSEYHLGLLHV